MCYYEHCILDLTDAIELTASDWETNTAYASGTLAHMDHPKVPSAKPDGVLGLINNHK